MDYKFLVLFLSGLLFLNIIYATDITGCQAINSSYLNDTLVLQNDLNESVLFDYNSCFYLEDDFSGASLTIDCNYHNISITSSEVDIYTEISDIFSNYWEEDNNDNTLHAFSLDSLTFKNCNFNFEAYVYYDSEADLNYEYGISVISISGADGNVYVNEVNVIDSNMYVEGQGISLEDFYLDTFDLNFYGSYLQPIEVESEYELDYEPNFIDLESGFLGTLTITDLTDGNFEYINSFIKVANKLERYDYDSCNIQVDDETDLNLLILQNVSLNFLPLYDMSYYSEVFGICDPIIYDDFSVLRDSNFQIIFDNVDINALALNNIDLNITGYNNLSPISFEPLVLDPGNAFLKLTNNSDINYIGFEDSNIFLNAGSLFLVHDNMDLEIHFDLNGLTIFDITIGDSGNANLITSLNSDYNILTVENLVSNDSEATELTFLQNIDSNFNYINFFNSQLNQKSAILFFVSYNDNFLDLNFFNTNIKTINNNPITFYDADLFTNSIDYLEISNLDLNTDENMFNLSSTTIGELIFTDSNIFFNNSLASFMDLDVDSNVQSGSIYNNIFSANFEYVAYADANNLFNVDFNTNLQENQLKRSIILDDDANYIGGNLYLDENGNNALALDCNVSEFIGIYDCSLDLGMSTGEYIYDYYPLVEYSLNNLPDILVYDFEYLSDFFFNNGNLDFNIFYTNIGIDSTDINLLFYVIKNINDFNIEDSNPAFVLNPLVTVEPDNNYNSFFRYIFPLNFVCMGENCGGPQAGLYSIYVLSLINNEQCTLDLDYNCENNYLYAENVFAFYDDGNYLLDIYDIDVNQSVEGNIRVDCNILNVGDINSNLDYNVYLGYGDYNDISHEYEFEFTQDNISESISAFDYKIVSFNVDVNAEDYNFRCEVADLGYSDSQYIKEFSFSSVDSNLSIDLVADSVDLNVYNVSLGEYVDFNFTYSNLGPDNATDFNVICGVYSNDIFLTNMFNENISGSFTGTDSYTRTILGDMAGSYDFNCYLISNAEADSNMLNNFVFGDTLTVSEGIVDENIDLIIYDIDLNSYNINVGDYLDLNLSYGNIGSNTATDFNYMCSLLDVNLDFVSDLFNVNATYGLNPDTNIIYNYSFQINSDGNYYIGCNLESYSESDSNSENQRVSSELIIVNSLYLFVDLNASLSSSTYVTKGNTIEMNLTIVNDGNKATDSNYIIYFYTDNELEESCTINRNNVLAPNDSAVFGCEIDSSDISIGAHTLKGLVDYQGVDLNADNNFDEVSLTLQYVDLNISELNLSSSSITEGDLFDINFTILNSGDANTDTNYIIQFYIDSNEIESCTQNISSVLSNGNNIVYSCNNIDSTGLSVGDHNVIGLVTYLGYDNNSDNNSSLDVLTINAAVITYVDLNASNMQVSDGNVIYGNTFDMNFTVTNSGDANTDSNFMVYFYIDDVLQNSCTQNDSNVLNVGNNRIYTCETISTIGLSLGLHTLTGVVDYLGTDNNAGNNSTSTELYIKFIDLNAISLDFNSNTLIYGEALDINFGYKNLGNANVNADYNIIYYVSNTSGSPAVANYQISTDLNSNTIDYNSYVWNSNILGDVNVYVCIYYNETEYSELNNCIQETYHVYYRDISVINAEISEPLVYGGDLNISVDLNNLGDFDSNDVNVYIYVLDSQNADNNLINPVSILDFNAYDVWNITSTFSNFNLTLNDLNILVEVITSETDYNLENHSSVLFENVASVYYRDLNVFNVEFEDYNLVYGSNVNLDLNIVNNGNYDSNDVNVLVYFVENANPDNNFEYFTTENFLAGEVTTLNIIWDDVNIFGAIDILVELQNLVDYNELDNNRYFDNVANVGYVDLNSYIEIPDVNAGYTVDINCVVNNLGNLTVDSYTISYYLNGVLQDSNILSNLGANESYIQTFSFSPNVKINDQNLGCVVSYANDYNLLNNSYFIDKNIGSDSDVDLILESLVFNGALTDYTAKTIDCNVGNIGDENATEDYNVLFYVNNVLIDYNLIYTDLNVNTYNTVRFNWTPSANGTYVFKCVVDYNVLNYLGYDQNILNDFLTLTKTINLSSNNNSNNTSNGGGSNVSGLIKENKDSTITFVYNPTNTFSAIYLDSVNFGYKFDYPSKDLILNIFPKVPEMFLINVPDIFVIKYFEFNYSGDQDNLNNIIVNFSIKKTEIKDPKTIRLARYHNNQWNYYSPTFVDKGIYYQFTTNIPGFSYFAIVDYNLEENLVIDSNIPDIKDDINSIDNSDTNLITDSNLDQNIVLPKDKKFTFGYKTTIIILGIFAILVLLILFLINRSRKKKLNYNSAFRFAKAENAILEKELKEKTGYDF